MYENITSLFDRAAQLKPCVLPHPVSANVPVGTPERFVKGVSRLDNGFLAYESDLGQRLIPWGPMQIGHLVTAYKRHSVVYKGVLLHKV
ncbi:hypothetical protein ACQEWB_26335 [Streptomyces sp. CA-249302]|uniref:hypothetical protein n=1 Tax=Streptomyces sp. CA-249302 TaxID=3240058 RepID=UPI003D9232CD